MSDKIIALVDGSTYSGSVCDHAAWIAGHSGRAVEVLHVLGRGEGAASRDRSGAIALGARTALLKELAALDEQRAKLMMERGRAILEDAAARLEGAQVAGITTRLRHGDIVETVAEIEAQAHVIVMGKRGESADFATAHLGSNLERILRATRKPVLVAARAFRPIRRVLVAFDGGASALKTIEHIAGNCAFQGLEVQIVTVGPDGDRVTQGLESAQARLRSAGMSAATLVLAGQPDTALPRHVESSGFDMVVMGAYGHSRIRSLIIGSTTTAMIRACKVPLLLIR